MKLHNRQIKASFWTDGKLLRWQRDKRWFYEGLFQLSDDSGCLENDSFEMKLHLFTSPMDSDITVDMLDKWVQELIADGRLVEYVSDGKGCLFIRHFHRHQALRSPGAPEVPLPEWVVFTPSKKTRRCGTYTILPPYGDGMDTVRSPYGDQEEEEEEEELNKNLEVEVETEEKMERSPEGSAPPRHAHPFLFQLITEVWNKQFQYRPLFPTTYSADSAAISRLEQAIEPFARAEGGLAALWDELNCRIGPAGENEITQTRVTLESICGRNNSRWHKAAMNYLAAMLEGIWQEYTQRGTIAKRPPKPARDPQAGEPGYEEWLWHQYDNMSDREKEARGIKCPIKR